MDIKDCPICPKCGNAMNPIWFIDEEEKLDSADNLYKTGRIRNAISHFECPSCNKQQNVDNGFDEPWHY